jgi:hypothetical protein
VLIRYKTNYAGLQHPFPVRSVLFLSFLTATFSIPTSFIGGSSERNDVSPTLPTLDVSPALIRAGKTQWKVEGSPAFDACCFINVLTADPYYLKYYQADFDRSSPKLSPACRNALARLRSNKEKNGTIISAQLTLYFSAVDAVTLADILAALHEPEKMKQALQQSPYYSEDSWTQFIAQRDDLIHVFEELRATGFEQDWQGTVLPKVAERREELKETLPGYDIISRQESLLGFELPSHEVTIFLLYYSKPHGIKIVGTRFITHLDYPDRIVLSNAIHEMMHPPYRLQTDPELKKALEQLRESPFLMEKVRNHNPSFGYNSFEGFVEEDCVQALDQVINEDFGLATEAHKRWQTSDDGMHVLAVALYQLMKKEHFPENPKGGFRKFLVGKIQNGGLTDQQLRRLDQGYADRTQN